MNNSSVDCYVGNLRSVRPANTSDISVCICPLSADDLLGFSLRSSGGECGAESGVTSTYSEELVDDVVLRLSAAAEVEVEGGEPAGSEEEGGLSLIAADQSCSFTDITVGPTVLGRAKSWLSVGEGVLCMALSITMSIVVLQNGKFYLRMRQAVNVPGG